MPLDRNAPRDSLRETYDAMKVVGPAGFADAEQEDYADLGDAELPAEAAVRLADMTGRPVGDFEAGEYDHPDLDDLKEVSGE